MSLQPAVNTVTFRQFSPEETISLTQSAGVQALEWAGDVHVPTGNLAQAEDVARLCREAGARIISFASYYPCDNEGPGKGPFACNLGPEAALETTRALEAPAVRVWAGRQASELASESYRGEVVSCLRKFCESAGQHGINVHLEYHRNTLTDSPESTVALLKETACPNLSTYWQPRLGSDEATCLKDLDQIAPWLSHLHVFHWSHDGGAGPPDRMPLAQGRKPWEKYLAYAGSLPGEHFAMMEFVRGDTVEQFREDARILQELISVTG